jgi:hypothetical protein
MIFKKIMLLALIIISCLPSPIQGTSHADIRIKGIVALGLILGVGGTYRLCKSSKSVISRVCNVMAGVILMGAGVATILLSGELVQEVDLMLR